MVGKNDSYIPKDSHFNELEGISFYIDGKELKNPNVIFENRIKEENLILYTLDIDGEKYKFKRNIYEVSQAPIFDDLYDLTLRVGDIFNPMLGVKALSSSGENITENVIVRGTVDTSVTGTTVVFYSITDSGITTEATRAIHVKEYKVSLSPVPQNFSSICVKCDDNGILSYAYANRLSEEFNVIEATDTFSLCFSNIEHILVKVENEEITKFIVKDSIVKLDEPVKNKQVTISYKIKNSFSLNYGTGGDYLDIKFNTDIKPSFIEVNYECNDESNERTIDHLSLNSIYNTDYSGFIYIDRKKYNPVKIKIHSSVDYLYSKIKDKTNIYVEVLDKYNNPVRDVKVDITCTDGSLKIKSNKTDINGVIPFCYVAPNEAGEIIIRATHDNIESRLILKIKERSF